MAPLDPEAFWRFALAHYARGSVAGACLSLQGRRGADVNILLFCCWLATLHRRLDADGLDAVVAAVSDWRGTMLEPLRAIRRAVGEGFPEIAESDRQSVKSAALSVELECERIAQRKIVAAASGRHVANSTPESRPAASEMLESYVGMLVGAADSRDREDLRAILERM